MPRTPTQSSLLLYSSPSQDETTTTTTTSDRDFADIINGKEIAQAVRLRVQQRVQKLVNVTTPGLAVVLVGNRQDSQTYVRMKQRACEALGIASQTLEFDEQVTQAELLAAIQRLNEDDSMHAILVQLPLPKHLNEQVVLEAIRPDKDVDGLHPVNVAKLHSSGSGGDGDGGIVPCTPLGCLELLDQSNVELAGKHCVVLGRSKLVGWPLARLLLQRDATCSVLHSKTPLDLQKCLARQADVVVCAVGRAQLVTGDWLKPGAVVIDVGINSVALTQEEEKVTIAKAKPKTYKLVGDVDYESARRVCSKITPVPGGVGPMTIAMLLQNTLTCCEQQQQLTISRE